MRIKIEKRCNGVNSNTKDCVLEDDYEESVNERKNVKNKGKKRKSGIVQNENEKSLNERENLKNNMKNKSGIVYNESEELLNERETLENKKKKSGIVYNDNEELLNERENVENKKKKAGIVYKEYEESLTGRENLKKKKKKNKSEIAHNENDESVNERENLENKKMKSGILYNEYEESLTGRENLKKKKKKKKNKSEIAHNENDESVNERENLENKKMKSGILYNEYEESLTERENVKKKKNKSGIMYCENEELLNERENEEYNEEKPRIVCNEYEESLKETEHVESKVKEKKPGIVYLSSIPKYMTITYLRDVLSHFGELGRVYLQEDVRDIRKRKMKSKKVHARNFAEGWVEFKSKRIAKEVAMALNNTQIGGRKKSKFYDCIWTIKYLPRFKWTHLSERLSYERAVHKQRMRAEINQAKREADYFSLNIDKSEKLKRKMSKGQALKNYENAPTEIRQRETEDQILEKKNLKNKNVQSQRGGKLSENEDRHDFLKSIFA